jgi:hypothetical protein
MSDNSTDYKDYLLCCVFENLLPQSSDEIETEEELQKKINFNQLTSEVLAF